MVAQSRNRNRPKSPTEAMTARRCKMADTGLARTCKMDGVGHWRSVEAGETPSRRHRTGCKGRFPCPHVAFLKRSHSAVNPLGHSRIVPSQTVPNFVPYLSLFRYRSVVLRAPPRLERRQNPETKIGEVSGALSATARHLRTITVGLRKSSAPS